MFEFMTMRTLVQVPISSNNINSDGTSPSLTHYFLSKFDCDNYNWLLLPDEDQRFFFFFKSVIIEYLANFSPKLAKLVKFTQEKKIPKNSQK